MQTILDDELLDIKALQRILGLSRSEAYLAAHEIGPIRLGSQGRLIRISRQDLHAWLERRKDVA